MNKHRKLFSMTGLVVGIVASVFVVAAPAPVLAASAPLTKGSDPSVCSQGFLTFPTWFRGLAKIQETVAGSGTYECAIESPTDAGGLGPFIWHIVLNVIEMGLQIVAYLAAGFILWGGFLFLTSQGSPDAATKARKTIFDAVIGLGISIISIAAINLLSGILIRNP